MTVAAPCMAISPSPCGIQGQTRRGHGGIDRIVAGFGGCCFRLHTWTSLQAFPHLSRPVLAQQLPHRVRHKPCKMRTGTLLL